MEESHGACSQTLTLQSAYHGMACSCADGRAKRQPLQVCLRWGFVLPPVTVVSGPLPCKISREVPSE